MSLAYYFPEIVYHLPTLLLFKRDKVFHPLTSRSHQYLSPRSSSPANEQEDFLDTPHITKLDPNCPHISADELLRVVRQLSGKEPS